MRDLGELVFGSSFGICVSGDVQERCVSNGESIDVKEEAGLLVNYKSKQDGGKKRVQLATESTTRLGQNCKGFYTANDS